jgi:hypothetical protein
MRHVTARGAIAIALAATPLAGCGAEDVSPEAIADAAKATVASGGSRVHLSGEISTPQGDVRMTGDGVMDAAGRRARFEYDIGGVPGLDDGQMHQILDKYVMYMQVPALESELPDGKSWIKLDLRKATREFGLDIAQLGQSSGSDAARTLDQLRATGDVEKEGEEEVRGVETTHYRAVVDLRKYPELVPRADRAEAERGIEALIEQTGESEIPTEVWVDGRNLVRRMRQQMEMRAPDGGTAEMDFTVELFDFGTVVRVGPPPADEVYDVTELAAEQARDQASP